MGEAAGPGEAVEWALHPELERFLPYRLGVASNGGSLRTYLLFQFLAGSTS